MHGDAGTLWEVGEAGKRTEVGEAGKHMEAAGEAGKHAEAGELRAHVEAGEVGAHVDAGETGKHGKHSDFHVVALDSGLDRAALEKSLAPERVEAFDSQESERLQDGQYSIFSISLDQESSTFLETGLSCCAFSSRLATYSCSVAKMLLEHVFIRGSLMLRLMAWAASEETSSMKVPFHTSAIGWCAAGN